MKKWTLVPATGMALLLTAGCGSPNSIVTRPLSAPSSSGAAGTPTTSNTSSSANVTTGSNSSAQDKSSANSNAAKQPQNIYLRVLPGGKLGPDGKKHDAFSPSNFTITQGVPVTITITNFDNMQHSLTAPALGLNIQASPAQQGGAPGVTKITFTPSKPGNFQWRCIDPCDLDNNQWAMSHNGYMMGTITVTNAEGVAPSNQISGSSSDSNSNSGGNSGGNGYGGMMGGGNGGGMMGASAGRMNG